MNRLRSIFVLVAGLVGPCAGAAAESASSAASDLELLERFEPILVFSGGAGEDGRDRRDPGAEEEKAERFLPVSTADYFAEREVYRQRLLLPDVSLGRLGAGALAALDERHYLRFPAGRESQAGRRGEVSWPVIVTGAVLAIGLVALALWLRRRRGPKSVAWAFAAALSALGAVFFCLGLLVNVLLMSQGPDRAGVLVGLVVGTGLGYGAWRTGRSTRLAWLKWPLAALAVLVVLGGLIDLGRTSFSGRSANVFTLLTGMLLLAGLVVLTLRKRYPRVAKISLGVLGLSLLPFGLDMLTAIMETTSGLRVKAASAAAGWEESLRERDAPYAYYGRVVRRDQHVALQYFFFYAFNDWRYQGGFNSHEGDWEAVGILLEESLGKPLPVAVTASQHYLGETLSWADPGVRWEGDPDGGLHPVLCIAAGSHAAYFEPGGTGTVEMLDRGVVRGAISRLADFWSIAEEKAEEGRRTAGEVLELPDTDETGPSAVPVRDFRDCSGTIVGPAPDGLLPEQERFPWKATLLGDGDEATAWVEFRGRWGRDGLLRGESGPPGPKWDDERRWWVDPFCWMEALGKERKTRELRDCPTPEPRVPRAAPGPAEPIGPISAAQAPGHHRPLAGPSHQPPSTMPQLPESAALPSPYGSSSSRSEPRLS